MFRALLLFWGCENAALARTVTRAQSLQTATDLRRAAIANPRNIAHFLNTNLRFPAVLDIKWRLLFKISHTPLYRLQKCFILLSGRTDLFSNAVTSKDCASGHQGLTSDLIGSS
ncbi:hypothetical protein [Thalassospira tepidiphila]|jgi:hypothetical protein|uniref:hypothetical protein n=1 Tax=Thalassospira tepidiphila TaxID=393657 RepID=UPI001BCDFD26|nr:hypothetical protein [Thalassospira tepidiphila]